MICFPNCKINLGLRIKEKRPDGYHNIETILFPVFLADALEIIVSQDRSSAFSVTGLNIPGDKQQNLCLRACYLMYEKYEIPPVKIHLHKRIPMGSGLGGGSSNAAFTIKLLNDLLGLKLTNKQMHNLASEIGSDCAYFIENIPLFAYGKGDKFQKVKFSLKNFYIVLVKTPVHVDTATAYANITPSNHKYPVKEIVQLPVQKWKKYMLNDFEEYVFEKYPEISDVKRELYKQAAVYASLSGSGSAVYGIFRTPVNLRELFPDYFTWQGRSIF